MMLALLSGIYMGLYAMMWMVLFILAVLIVLIRHILKSFSHVTEETLDRIKGGGS